MPRRRRYEMAGSVSPLHAAQPNAKESGGERARTPDASRNSETTGSRGSPALRERAMVSGSLMGIDAGTGLREPI
jgi:hypothetical protein